MSPAAPLDAWLVGFGGWSLEDPAEAGLALTCVEAEAEWREAGWVALATILDRVVDGRLVWPVDAAERAELFEAAWRLGWPFASGGATGEQAGG